MANVRKVRTKSAGTHWQARWRERGPDGHDRSCAKNFPSHRAARDHANRMEQLVERRGIGGGKLTTATFFTHFIDELKDRGNRSPVTIEVYRHALDLAARELGEIPLAKLMTAHIDNADPMCCPWARGEAAPYRQQPGRRRDPAGDQFELQRKGLLRPRSEGATGCS